MSFSQLGDGFLKHGARIMKIGLFKIHPDRQKY